VSAIKDKYSQEVVPELKKILKVNNTMRVPRLEKIVLNIGVGEATQNAKALEAAEADLTAISGQKPIITRARKSVAAFKLRQGMTVGLRVTLRGERMYDFFSKLVNSALPRMREFKGVPAGAFDGNGNYNLGIKEQIIFPEIDYNKIDKLRGLEINIVTTAGNDNEARHLLEQMGMPFAKDEE